MMSWYLKASLTAEFDIQVQISLSFSNAEMSSILYLIPLNPSEGSFRFWSMRPICSHTSGSIYYTTYQYFLTFPERR